jgi:NTE family protein
MTKRALVLSGGSIKGAFQAGAIDRLLSDGFAPDAAYGISVGSLNAAFLADRAARQVAKGNRIDWPEVGRDLVQFWLTQVNGPEAILKKHNAVSLAWQVLWKKFNGLTNTDRLRELVRNSISRIHIGNSPLALGIGTVNVVNGDLVLATNNTDNILDYVIASAAIPIIMPSVDINKQVLVDGGVRDVAPLKFGIDSGATEICCIVCQSEQLDAIGINFRDALPFAERVMEIITNELVNNDLAYAELVNQHTPPDGTPAESGPFAGKRRLDIRVIRPERPISVALNSFTPDDINRMIDLGRAAAANPRRF